MPGVGDILGLENIMRRVEPCAAGFNQNNVTDLARQSSGDCNADRARTYDYNIGLCRVVICESLATADHEIDDANSLKCTRELKPTIAAVTKSGSMADDNA